MSERPLTPAQADRVFAAIEKGHQLEGQHPSVSALDRDRRILAGELSPEDAEAEMRDALQQVIADEQETLRMADSRALVRRLTQVLGPTLVSPLAGATNTRGATTRVTPEGPNPNTEAIKRLRCAEAAWRALSEAESDDVARAWFVGGNPRLGEDTPVTAIREGRFTEVVNAVRSFVHDSFSG